MEQIKGKFLAQGLRKAWPIGVPSMNFSIHKFDCIHRANLPRRFIHLMASIQRRELVFDHAQRKFVQAPRKFD
jgi:hypothetical protein